MANHPPTGAPPKFAHQDVSKLGIASALLKASQHIAIAAFRTHLGNLNIAQDRYVTAPNATPTYLQYCTLQKLTPESLTLPSGTQAHWLGSKDAPKVLVYFHGGGYVLPCTSGHVLWLDELQKSLGPSVSALLLAYNLAPEATYPTQLHQAVELMRHLTETEGRSPSDIIIGGDSAGGNLTLSLLSHLAHSHPDIAELRLNGKIHAAMLIPPWTSLMQHHTAAHIKNAERDMFDARTLSRWSAAFLGSASPFAGDPYNEPVLASAEWWEPVANVVDEVLIWGGGNEILIDGIEAFARKFSIGFRRRGGHVNVVVTKGAMHEEMIIERVLGYKGDSGSGSQDVIEGWVKAKL
ncbi:alpha/beta hydrolase fold domain-containing protein [Lizonia empirigonia]|nr:alpha/beta hydrolase fold domain-containing protein [Lizonia empirigonia]